MVAGVAATPDLAVLLESWELALRAERKAPGTIKSYGDGVRRFLSWCETQAQTPFLNRSTTPITCPSTTSSWFR